VTIFQGRLKADTFAQQDRRTARGKAEARGSSFPSIYERPPIEAAIQNDRLAKKKMK
jgi:hypothetical protein